MPAPCQRSATTLPKPPWAMHVLLLLQRSLICLACCAPALALAFAWMEWLPKLQLQGLLSGQGLLPQLPAAAATDPT